MNPEYIHHDPVGAATLQLIQKADRLNQWMYETIKPYLKGSILEVGSGTANISRFAIKDRQQVTLSDYSPDYAAALKKEFSKETLVPDVLMLDLQDPAFIQKNQHLEGHFDSIFMLNVIEHLADDGMAIRYCHFLLRPGGRLILLAPAYPYLYCEFDRALGHYRRYTRSSLSQVAVTNGFNLVTSHYFNFLGIAGWLVSGKWLGHKQLAKNEMAAFNKLVPLAKAADALIGKRAGLSAIVVTEK